MDDRLRVLLPYGLSSYYKNLCTKGKAAQRLHGPPVFRIASLEDLSTVEPSYTFPLRHAILNTGPQLASESENNMGFQRNMRRINMGPASGKEKRGRRHRSQATISVSKVPRFSKHGSKTGRKQAKASKVDSAAQQGTSRSVPITLDSDDDEPAKNNSTQFRASGSKRYVRLESDMRSRHSCSMNTDLYSALCGSTRTPLRGPDLEQFRYEPHSSFSDRSERSSSAYSPLSDTYSRPGFVPGRSAPSPCSPIQVPTKNATVRKKPYTSIYAAYGTCGEL